MFEDLDLPVDSVDKLDQFVSYWFGPGSERSEDEQAASALRAPGVLVEFLARRRMWENPVPHLRELGWPAYFPEISGSFGIVPDDQNLLAIGQNLLGERYATPVTSSWDSVVYTDAYEVCDLPPGWDKIDESLEHFLVRNALKSLLFQDCAALNEAEVAKASDGLRWAEPDEPLAVVGDVRWRQGDDEETVVLVAPDIAVLRPQSGGMLLAGRGLSGKTAVEIRLAR